MTSAPQEPDSGGVHEKARREKLQRIVELGHDPWGSRFDDRSLIGECSFAEIIRRFSRPMESPALE